MNSNFETETNKFLKEVIQTLVNKQKEYSTEEDPLHNFRIAAELQGCTVPTALTGMMTKHVVSIYDIVHKYEYNNIIPTKKQLNEKIGDCINYLLLLRHSLYSGAKD